MLPTIQSIINQHGDKQLIVVHMLGSHIDYDDRYTKADTRFEPRYADIGSPLPSSSSRMALVNSYDNTLVALDRFLDQLRTMLDHNGGESIMIFTSDHGENLYDDDRNLFMHASPIPSFYEVHVPLVVWCNDLCQKNNPAMLEQLRSNKTKRVSHRDVFFTTLDIAGFKIPDKYQKHSLSGSGFVPSPRSVLSKPDEWLKVSDLR